MNEDATETYRQHALLLHLTDEELAGQLESTLTGLAARRAAAHLKRCLICEGRLEFLRSMTETPVVPFPVSRSGLWRALNDAHFELDHVPAKAAHTRGWKHATDADEWFEWRMFEQDDGTLSLSIASKVTEEAGAHVDLFCDQVPGWQRTTTFIREGNEIVARTVLSLDDRRQLPKDCRLRCRLRHPEGESSE